jgi:CubicO group peptidase (beta-lactamase class C family)
VIRVPPRRAKAPTKKIQEDTLTRWPDGRLSADAGLTGEGVLCALGIHGQWIYIHPEAELVIIRMGSEATPLNLDRVRGWRRGFDAIAEYFL